MEKGSFLMLDLIENKYWEYNCKPFKGEQLEGIYRCCECKFFEWCATKLEVNSKQVEKNDKDSQDKET
jgi:hypothetical protein